MTEGQIETQNRCPTKSLPKNCKEMATAAKDFLAIAKEFAKESRHIIRFTTQIHHTLPKNCQKLPMQCQGIGLNWFPAGALGLKLIDANSLLAYGPNSPAKWHLRHSETPCLSLRQLILIACVHTWILRSVSIPQSFNFSISFDNVTVMSIDRVCKWHFLIPNDIFHSVSVILDRFTVPVNNFDSL